MSEPFIISVAFKDEVLEFPAQLFTSVFSYQIQVLIHEVLVNFERDDSGEFRAIAAQPDDTRFQKIDMALLQAVISQLEDILS